ncbi:Xaa-Pro aminopeptidase [Bryobacterales bacterium F-183]|nr:Xaa-Pro aminopeptidase [Bryobacterales bacterium F-183]
MRSALLALVAYSSICLAQVPVPPLAEYAQRRAALQKDLDGVVVLFGWVEESDEVYRKFQQSSFQYLTGFEEPGAILIVSPKSQVLFVSPRNERRERYNGKRVAAGDADAQQKTGFTEVLGVEKFEARLSKALEEAAPIYAFPNDTVTPRLKALAPLRDIKDLTPLLAKLRMKKSAAELETIRYATDASIQAHLESWKRLKAGNYEYQAASSFVQTYTDLGCEKPAYAPIFGSGPNSTILHYNSNRRRMDTGDIIVIDAAASCGGYASDITRSLPINGKFTARQKEIYDIVLGAQKAAVAALKPGVTLAQLTGIAKKYMEEHGGYGKYFIHGVGHHIGLDVHDLSTAGPLEEGAVVTIEPGIYIPDEKIGVRIEDVYLVTKDGNISLSDKLPKETPELEKALAR